jgi:hypothetical protein
VPRLAGNQQTSQNPDGNDPRSSVIALAMLKTGGGAAAGISAILGAAAVGGFGDRVTLGAIAVAGLITGLSVLATAWVVSRRR